jgi:hypothetical protein
MTVQELAEILTGMSPEKDVVCLGEEVTAGEPFLIREFEECVIINCKIPDKKTEATNTTNLEEEDQ